MRAVLENELSDHPTYRSITSSYALNYFDMNKGKVNDFYHITFMTENLEFNVSNLQCTSYKVL